MKKILPFFLIAFLQINLIALKAQTPYHPFPEDSAQWSIWDLWNDSITGNAYTYSFQLKVYDDTLINGIMYNKIYKSTDIAYPAPTDSLHCFMRQDTTNRKVYVRYPYYMYNDSSEILLYDFNLQVGDTFYLKLINSGNIYPAIVTFITDSVQFNNNQYRRVFELEFVNFPVWGIACDYSANMGWTEGMGSGGHTLYTEIPENFCEYHNYNLQCYWHNGYYLYGGTYCDFTTNIIDNDFSQNDLIIYPNPADEIINFNLKDGLYSIIIHNIFGEKITQINAIEKDFIYSSKELQQGLYHVTLTSNNGN